MLACRDMPSFDDALARLDHFVRQRLSASATPGLALALTDHDHLLHVATYGYADVAARRPVTPDTLFDIASIGKWFTAVALLQQHEAGLLDLHAPVSASLPWFGLRSRFAPITAHHLLSHTAGLAISYTETPGSRYDAAALRDVEAAYAPGAHFHYSNTGYKALGFLLEAVCGRSRAAAIEEGIYAPLDMSASVATVTQEWRERMAVGYAARYDDRPERRGAPPLPAPWVEFTTGDGGGVSTATDMAAYARMILNRGRGPRGRILSPESFALMARPVAGHAFDQDGLSYGYGVIIEDVDGHTYLGHGGGAPGYQSAVLADMDAGLGVVTLVNDGRGAPHLAVARTALGLLRAVIADAPWPDLPELRDPVRVEDAVAYVGLYRAGGGDTPLAVIAEGERLMVAYEGGRLTLERRGPGTFYVDHPAFDRFLLRFGRADGRVVEVFHGPDWYVNERYTGPTSFVYPTAWGAYPGHYRSHNPWASNVRIVLRKGALALVYPNGSEQPLVPLDDGAFRLGAADHSPERVRFDTVIDGQALRASLSGELYYRALTA